MPGKSKIEWTQTTWNPTTGCTKVSPGCDHCYAETFAERFRGVPGHPYEQGFDLKLWPERLDLPKRWRQPRMIFVNSMSDLFHAQVPYGFVSQVWDTMRATPRHTYQILTKRPDRMARFAWRLAGAQADGLPEIGLPPSEPMGILPNVWLGTSVESQDYVERIQHLRGTPTVVRFLSLEPLLGPIDLLNVSGWRDEIDWVIAGGESGHGARPCRLEWLEDLRDQCIECNVPFFLKQLGSVLGRNLGCRDHKGGDMAAWPADLCMREMPITTLERSS